MARKAEREVRGYWSPISPQLSIVNHRYDAFKSGTVFFERSQKKPWKTFPAIVPVFSSVRAKTFQDFRDDLPVIVDRGSNTELCQRRQVFKGS
ncbi:hypothetical protein RRG08_045695 [Elysia crispata]|uniref:Uncharacterized protein n=1 Tax=Elysia crispata TaxID=231223 RepID=A0AAE0Z239_9GAST|nr:hypothetical protein RRG08_045695 [Elysia crispata]